ASVPHGGELLGAEHVRQALDHLAPDRLGHGVRSVEDPRVLAEVVQRGITLEVCPGSNVALGVYEHAAQVPLRPLLEARAQIALGADDPLLFGTRLADQYQLARDEHAVTDAELAELARGSIRGSRAPAELRRQLLAEVEQWLASSLPCRPGLGEAIIS
ncbi:MAG: adenosine deaminase family protein, partial [Angustibacter sp.]